MAKLAENEVKFTLQEEPTLFTKNGTSDKSIKIRIPSYVAPDLPEHARICYISKDKQGFKKLKKELTSGSVVTILAVAVGEYYMVWNPEIEEHEPSEVHMDEKGLPRFMYRAHSKAKSNIWLETFQAGEAENFKAKYSFGKLASTVVPTNTEDISEEDVIDVDPIDEQTEEPATPVEETAEA